MRQSSKYMERYLKEGDKRVIGRKRQVTAKRKDGRGLGIELGVQEVESDLGRKKKNYSVAM